jgi:hypothetical protein
MAMADFYKVARDKRVVSYCQKQGVFCVQTHTRMRGKWYGSQLKLTDQYIVANGVVPLPYTYILQECLHPSAVPSSSAFFFEVFKALLAVLGCALFRRGEPITVINGLHVAYHPTSSHLLLGHASVPSSLALLGVCPNDCLSDDSLQRALSFLADLDVSVQMSDTVSW